MSPENKTLTLAQARRGRAYRISAVAGEEDVRRRILALGFHPGDRISPGHKGVLGGPIQVTNLGSGASAALARSIAALVRVVPDDGSDG